MSRITRATRSPVRRAVSAGRLGEMVLTLEGESLTIRPLRSRKPIFTATYSEIIGSVLLVREPRPRRGRGVKKGRR